MTDDPKIPPSSGGAKLSGEPVVLCACGRAADLPGHGTPECSPSRQAGDPEADPKPAPGPITLEQHVAQIGRIATECAHRVATGLAPPLGFVVLVFNPERPDLPDAYASSHDPATLVKHAQLFTEWCARIRRERSPIIVPGRRN